MKRTGELVRLEIPAQPAFVGVARSVVAAVAAGLDGIDDDRLEDLRVAVSEACTTAVEANRRGELDERIVVRCSVADAGLEVCIEDTARAFDIDSVPEPPGPESPPSAATERGWGLQLIQALVDDVRFRTSDAGTAVDLVMRFESEAG